MGHWVVYIIQTESDQLYTGITTDLERRLLEHQTGKKGARFFRTCKPKQIVFSEHHPNRSAASKREHQIKKMSRTEKLALIEKKS